MHGGKVIGQGYNDYRSGFSGGALKTDRLPLRNQGAPSVATLTKRPELKFKFGLEDEEQLTAKTFTPSEHLTGGGNLTKTPLSMHPEIMAIHFAQSSSNTMVSSAVASDKPCSQLLGDSKRKARSRRDAVRSYVETVCKAALVQSTAKSRHGKVEVQQWRFEESPSRPKYTEPHSSYQVEQREHGFANREQCDKTRNEE